MNRSFLEEDDSALLKPKNPKRVVFSVEQAKNGYILEHCGHTYVFTSLIDLKEFLDSTMQSLWGV